MKKRKIVYVGFCYPHHRNTHAGYNHIKDFLDYDYVIDCDKEMDYLGRESKNLLHRILRKIYRIIFGSGVPLNIIRCILLSLFHRNLVFHFIYPEMTFKWFHHFKFGNKIVFTIHQPYKILTNSDLDRYVKYVDGLILMANEDEERIKKHYNCNNVIFIPHGISVDFYKPKDTDSHKEQICMVGSWLRNFSLAYSVFSTLKERHYDLRIIAVTAKENFEKLPSFVIKKTGITDEELLEIYQTSRCAFFPLYSYTANNAMLEAAATGCQILICSDNISESYFSNNEVFFEKMNTDAAVKAIENIVYYGAPKDNCVREKVIENYSWNKVGSITKEYLMSIE